MRSLSREEETLFKSLPKGRKFTSKEINPCPSARSGASTKIAYILRGLADKGAVKKVGKTGDCNRYILWEVVKI